MEIGTLSKDNLRVWPGRGTKGEDAIPFAIWFKCTVDEAGRERDFLSELMLDPDFGVDLLDLRGESWELEEDCNCCCHCKLSTMRV